MKKIFDRLTALVMVMLMFIQSCVPAITSFAKEEELDKRYVIQKLETLKQDTYANFSLNLATVIDDKNLDTDTNVKFVLNTTNVNSNIKLLVRKDFSLYDERTFDTVEEAHKEFDRVDKSLKDQGLSLDVSVVQEDGKYRIHNNYVPQADKEDFGDDYKVYSLKVVPEFDFDKEGLFNKLPENLKSTEQHRLQLAEERRLQQDGEVPEGDKHNRTYIFDFKVDKAVDSKLTTIALNKDDNNPLEVKQNADLFAAILDDKTYSTYQTEQLPAEVTSSIEHKKEVAEAKAKAEADAKAKAEADEKAKKEAEEKAKADAKAKEEADAKAKQEADAKAKAEADKKKAEEAKKTEEQKALDEKAKQEADAKAKQEADAKAKAEAEKLKAEAEAKQKAEAEAKAKQEQLAKEQAEAEAKKLAEEKAKKDLENKKLLGLEKDTEENQEEEPIIKKKETTEEVKKEPATPEERKQKAEEFDKALQDKKEDIKKSEDKKDANNKEDNKSEENKGLLENIKKVFGLTNLQKADRELKAILSVKANGLKEVQALLSSFEAKYHLTKEEQAKLMDDNKDAIKALIEKDADKNFNPQMLFAPLRALGTGLNLDGKKFTIITEYDISNANGPVQKGQYFTIHLDKKLTVNDASTLPSIKYNNEVIATPKYNSNNTITYTLTKDINENIQVPLNIPVDYNVGEITLDDDGTFTVINKVTGIGVNNPPKDLVPQKVDKNGNLAGSIIEPGRDDVTQIVDSSKNYRLDIDSVGNPVIKNGEMVGINWVVEIESSKDLKNDLGMKMNFTLVEGSGLEKIESITSSDSTEVIQDNDAIKGKTGIVDSKHSVINQSTKSYRYSIYTPISNKQAAYVLDISTVLTKDLTNGKPYVGAVRSVMNKGYPKDKVEQHTPTRVGINNRTTIEGKFLSNTNAQWTITDGVCTLDKNNGLPLENRTLEGANIKTGKRVVYGVDNNTSSPTYGQMVVKEQEKSLTSIPTKEADPNTSQAVGNIGVYQFTHDVDESKTPKSYKISGVKISKFQDLYIDQEWNLPVNGMTMPGQKFIAKDKDDNTLGEVHVDAGTAGQNTRLVTIPDARYWNIADDGTANKVGHKISQEFDSPTVTQDGKTYKYNENANYYQINTNSQYIHNSAIDITKPNPVTFTVVKVDSKDPSKKLSGATFKLLGDKQPSIVTDSEGKATFSNVLPGTYTLTEEKAPAGYKLDQSQKTITIAKNGTISVDGSNIQSSGKNVTKLVQHDSAPNWPDYMNAMHYGKINDKGELEFYLYLKPQSDNGAGGTNRNTRLNISIPGVNITDVTAYDVSPGYRANVKYSMEQQNADGYIPLLGKNVIGASNNHVITGTQNKQDPYTGKTGYQIYFPQERFENDWGFLVKVKANIGDKQSVSLDYDWLTNKDTAEQTKLTQNVIINKASGEAGENQLIVTNEQFTKSPISATKFGDTFDKDGKRNRLQGAEFVLKDSNRRTLANKFTDGNGEADFGQYPPGTYRLEEVQAPDGYIKSNVYFEVVVDEQGQVKYNARFEDGIGTPEAGRDYYIEQGEETDTSKKATVTNVNQRLEYLENEPGDIGTKTGVWEAYSYESLKYHADVTLSDSAPGSRFEIQFDRNLDFTQYFSEFPKIVIDGVEVADPYFDYDTNLLTYVFNDKSKGGQATASINLRGIIPDKYYAKETGQYKFNIKVAPGVANVGGSPNLTKEINADYGRHHTETGDSNQSYYFRDVYQKEDGNWYVTVLTYLNPLGFTYSAKKVSYNWITTDFQSNRIAEWSGKGYKPLYELNDVKVYGTGYGTYRLGDLPLNRYMPLSMGIRPEQEPNIYHLLAHQSINPNQGLNRRENDVTITYDPSQITRTDKLNAKAPLTIQTPKPNNKGGYVIEQTFKITDIEQFNKKWRAFLMYDGNLTSAFASKANVNTAIGDQAGGEIPKYYKEIVGLINNKYTPGSFKLTKYDEANQENKLRNATFALTDENGKKIYRTSDQNGVVSFEGIAPGRYSLEETKAPDGYSLTNKKWQVTILNDGSVRIRETSITGESKLYTNATVPINIPVSNKPAGQKFRVYKKDGNGKALAGAKFKITDPENPNFSSEATSGPNGIVEFDATLVEGKNYIIEEVEPPTGYNPLNKKWVLRVEDGKTKVYNYSESTEIGDVEKSLLGDEGTEWVDVKGRNTSGWSNYDNRWTGWVANSQDAEHLGTRIIAINKEKKYVVQRYIINPEAKNIDAVTTATIHREKPEYPNMDWYKGDEEIKIFTLEPKTGGNTDGKVTGLISDLRLASYTVTDITKQVTKTPDTSHHGETRLKLNLPATNKPIVVDVKVPYKDENGGVGTGMDWREGDTTYWKSDYYERVSDIKTAGLVSETGGTIVGSYVAEGSLDVTNDLKTYGFKIKKVKEDKTTAIPGAVFKLTGPGESIDERFMTTGSDGMISFNGLKPGEYKLEETEPAPGYEQANTDWTVRITNSGKVYIKDNNSQQAPTVTNANLSVVPAASSSSANGIRQYLANNSASLYGVNTGLQFGPEIVEAALRAGDNLQAITPYNIDSSNANISISAGDVNTTDGSRDIKVKISPKTQQVGQNKSHWVLLIDRTKDWSAKNSSAKLDDNINKFLTDLRAKADTPGAEVYVSIIEYSGQANHNKLLLSKTNIKNLDNAQEYSYTMGTLEELPNVQYNLNEETVKVKNYLSRAGVDDRSTNVNDGAAKLQETVNANIANLTSENYDNKYVINFATFTGNNAERMKSNRSKFLQFESMWAFYQKGYTRVYFHQDQVATELNGTIKEYSDYIAGNADINGLYLTNKGIVRNKGFKNPREFAPYVQKEKLDSILSDTSNFASQGKEESLLKNGILNITTNDKVKLNSYSISKNENVTENQTNPTTNSISKNISLGVGESLELNYKISLDQNAENNIEYTIHNLMTYKPDENAQAVKLDTMPLKTKKVVTAPTKYDVNLSDIDHGSVTPDKIKVSAGETVNLIVKPDDGYVLDRLYYADEISTEKHTINGNSFVMPGSNVMIYATFKPAQGTAYNITAKQPQEGGTVTVPTSAKAGEDVTLTASPKDGYELDKFTVTKDTDGSELQVTDGKFKMPAGNVTVSATFKKIDETPDPKDGWKEITTGSAQITNKQTGLDLKIYKKDRYDRKLEGAIFTIRKTDENYKNIDQNFGVKTGTSNDKGLVEFKDKDGNPIRLQVGYYIIEETAAPLGYRKANAPWKVQVVEENGQLVAKYKGPEETPQSFIEKNENLDIKTANGVKYATKITHIDTESRTYIQRVYIDTRGKNGTVNVQIKPKHKREEIDRPGLPPVTIKEGVKTAYRSTYKITGLDGDPNKAQMIKILNDYDVSYPDVTVVNTARWRPFDWGFDEDQLNLEPGVYYIDIEGFYDTSIIDRNVTNEVAIDKNYNFTQKDEVTPSDEPVLKDPYKLTENDIPDEDLGKIDIDIEFFDGAREFQQLKNSNGKIVYGVVKDENGKDEASYQDGVVTLRQWLEDNYGKEYADNWFATKLPGQKYVNQLSKIVKIGKKDVYQSGRIIPPVTPGQQGYKAPFSTISTSMDISPLYSSNATNTVPQEGLSIINDAERYNITFSKHGKLTDTDSVEEITKRRLEGAVFKLEKRVREGIYEEVEGSYVSSAFNGYFGFRGLEPGRYRLIEVQAPKNYKPINGPLLYFSVETVSIVSQRITDPRTGENIDINNVDFYFPGNDTAYKFENLEMHDPVTNKVIKFKEAKNADLETTKIIDPTDSTKETEISLKDLSIKFPGEIKDKEGKVIKDTYLISEIQITPTSNGYISLEYDKANGVYQYIPEKSTTEENGLLVDYVTSATAKNMGKIVNEKPGKGEITIRKIDQKGNAIKATNQLPGAKFRITNKETGKTEDGTVGADGTLKFTGLNIGHYRLEEIESPNGYINNKQVWNFTVGGEDLDPYAKDAPVKRKDVSSSITLSESKLSVLNPNSKDKGLLSDNQEEMHPHLGEVFEFANKYTIDSNLKINPGDYFVLKLSDNIDLHGIMETDISNLDIIADGVGTIAKAEYNRKEGTITYTFTNYADTYSLVEFSNKIKAYINLNKVPEAGNQTIGRGVVGHEMKKDNINVVYDSMTARETYQGTDGKMYEMTQNHLNLGSKIIKFNPDTGEFVHYYYVNRDRSNTPRSRFYYSSDQDIENLNIDYYYLDSNANLDELMPLSFGVNEDDPRLPEPVRIRSRASLDAGQEESFTFPGGLDSNSTYLVKVTGKVVGEDKDGYVGHGVLEMIDNPARYVTRWDKQYFFKNEATAKANLIIQAVNPENKIKFRKIDQDGNPLEGATFQLSKKNNEGTWDYYGQQIKTGKDGLVEYTKLPKGEYRLVETEAPDGYEKLEGAILEFEVDASGNIHRSEKTNATTDPNKQPVYVDESGSIAIPIVNKKPQKIKFEKVDASDKKTKLEGAEFEVWYKANETDKDYTTQLKVYEKTVDGKTERLVLKEDDNIPTGYKHVEGDKFVTGKDGLVEFNVLDNGYYALKEVKAPKGYIKPRDIVKEFVVKDGKIQTEQYKTEMDVKKTKSGTYANGWHDEYMTSIAMRFNPNHEEITYVKDKSTISLSGLPLENEFFENNVGAKTGVTIKAYTVDKENGTETFVKSYKVDLKNYDSYKGKETIDLYDLVKGNTTDGSPVKSDKTLVFKMSPQIGLTTKLDINSKIVIDDKTIEDRTFHIGTKGDDYVDHSYSFTTMEEISKYQDSDVYEPIDIENHKATFPHTGALGIIGFLVVGAVMMATAYYKYRRKRRESALS